MPVAGNETGFTSWAEGHAHTTAWACLCTVRLLTPRAAPDHKHLPTSRGAPGTRARIWPKAKKRTYWPACLQKSGLHTANGRVPQRKRQLYTKKNYALNICRATSPTCAHVGKHPAGSQPCFTLSHGRIWHDFKGFRRCEAVKKNKPYLEFVTDTMYWHFRSWRLWWPRKNLQSLKWQIFFLLTHVGLLWIYSHDVS